MRKLLTAGIFGTILSLTGANYADASIISRGFFDEAMENYATNTALDLKANQTDLTALSNKIGTLPTELDLHTRDFTFMFNNIRKVELPADYPLSQFMIDILFGNAINGVQMPGLQNIIGVIMNGGYLNESWGGYQYMGLPDLSRILGTPYLVENEGYVLNRTEFPFSTELFPDLEPQNEKFDTSIIEYLEQDLLDIRSPTLAGVTNKLLNGWTKETGGLANPGIKAMFDGWTDKGGTYFPGLYSYSKGETLLQSAYNSSNSDLDSARLLINGANATTIRGVDYTGPVYPLWKLSEGIDQIGTLPSGNFPDFPGYEFLFPEFGQPYTYPTSLAELITAIYGYGEGRTKIPGLLAAISAGFSFDFDRDGRPDDYIGLIPNYQLAKNANDKIGTLPDGITLQGLYEQWNVEISDSLDMLKSFWDSSNTKSILSGIDPKKFPNDIRGAFNATYSIFDSIFSGLLSGWRDIDTNTDYGGIVELNEGWLDKSTNTTYQGIKALNEGWLDKSTNTTYLGVKGLNDAIGTLPTQISGNDTTWARYGFETPIELPTTVGGMFDMLFHDERNSTEVRFSLSGIMGRILAGSYRDDGSAVFYGLYDLTDALELGNNRDNYPLVTAVKANTTAIEKIGTVPAGYDNVGAALTAMKSDIDAKNLPSTSDDGQYVLTAKKVGETITYTWVKMDLTTEEQGQ